MHHFANNDGNRCTWNVRYNGKGTRLLCRENRQIVINDIPIGYSKTQTRDTAGDDGASSVGFNKVRLTTLAAQQAADDVLFFDGPPRTSANCFAGKDDELVAASATDGKIYMWSVPDGRGERTIDQPLLVLDGSRYTRCVRYSPQNCALASCGPYSTVIKLWTPLNLTRQQQSTDDDGRAAAAAAIIANYRASPISDSSSSSTDDDA